MYYADYRPGVKLYVKRVYITDDDKELLPSYLRFVRGVIDSEDLPLNVSREILQQNRVMSAIRTASVKKLLGEFAKISEQNTELYTKFIEQYNRPLKEGLYSDYGNRDALLDLVRFKSSTEEGWVSRASYKERMPADRSRSTTSPEAGRDAEGQPCLPPTESAASRSSYDDDITTWSSVPSGLPGIDDHQQEWGRR